MTRRWILIFSAMALIAELGCGGICVGDDRPRLFVLTDIGGDPDDQQSLIRLMVYSNEFQIEGLVATASGIPGELKVAITRPDLVREIVTAYGSVRDQLVQRADGWPETQSLLEVIKSGNPQRGVQHIGEGHDTEGSAFLIQSVDAGSATAPLNISIWGGQTDFAQALWRVRTDRGTDGLTKFIERFRVYDIADQDSLANWIQHEFPGLFYVLSKAKPGTDPRLAAFRGMYLSGDESLTSKEWIEANIRSSGPLGKLYPTKTSTHPNRYGCMKEGDTPSWFFYLPQGGNDPSDPTKPGWGGQFYLAADGWYRDDDVALKPRESVSRWRPEFQADFAMRMSWCKAE